MSGDGLPTGDEAASRERGRGVEHALGIAVLVGLSGWLCHDMLVNPLTEVLRGPDVHLYLWNMWWLQHSVFVEVTSPFSTSYLLHPAGASLLVHSYGVSALLPWAWLPALLGVPEGVVVAHNSAIAAAVFGSALATYLLAYGETRSCAGALVAAVLFTFSGYRLYTTAWTDFLSVQYLVLYVFFLLRSLRGSRFAPFAAGVFAALVAYNQSTHVVFGVLLTAGLVLSERFRPAVLRSLCWICATALLFAFPLILLLVDTLLIQGIEFAAPSARASGLDLARVLLPHHYPSWADPALELLAPSLMEDVARHSRLTGLPLFNRVALSWSLLGLIVLGAAAGTRLPRRWLVLGVVALLLALGPHPIFKGEVYEQVSLPFALLRLLPGLDLLKGAYRFIDLANLCLAIVAAAALAGLCERLGGRRAIASVLVSGLAVLLVLLEHCAVAIPTQTMPVGGSVRQLAAERGRHAVFHYPALAPGIWWSQWAMWHQVVHQKPMVDGFVARFPKRIDRGPILLSLYSRTTAPAEEQVRAIEATCAAEAYDLQWILVRPAAIPWRERRSFLRAMERRLDLLYRDNPPGKPARRLDQWLFRCTEGIEPDRSVSEAAPDARREAGPVR